MEHEVTSFKEHFNKRVCKALEENAEIINTGAEWIKVRVRDSVRDSKWEYIEEELEFIQKTVNHMQEIIKIAKG